MANFTRFFKRFHVLSYFVLTLIISWGGILSVMGTGGILGIREVSGDVMPLVYLATLLGPSVSGILMTGIVNGGDGFRNLVKRLFKWRVGVQWYAVAILTAPILISLVLFGLSSTSPAFLPAISSADNKLDLLLIGIVMGVSVGFFEELGWTGFALPKLRQRYGTFSSGIALGLFWGFWHLPLFLGSIQSSGTIPQIFYLVVLLFSFLPAYRVLMVWVYDHNESLLTLILMHAPLAASQLILIPPSLNGVQTVTYDLIFALILWICAGMAVLTTRRRSELEKTGFAR